MTVSTSGCADTTPSQVVSDACRCVMMTIVAAVGDRTLPEHGVNADWSLAACSQVLHLRRRQRAVSVITNRWLPPASVPPNRLELTGR